MSLLIHGAAEVVQVSNTGQAVKVGKAMDQVAVLKATQKEGISIAVDREGIISAIGPDSEVAGLFPDELWNRVIDARGRTVLPGFADAHTHPVWGGDRVHEYAMKLSGKSYMDVHKEGGGIYYTVEHTEAATEKQLLRDLLQRLTRMSKNGTTLVECKSGYGLNTETELKLLKVLERAKSSAPLTISSTFCGAHAPPKGKTSADAMKNIMEEQLPAIILAVGNGEINVDSIDVFCEKDVFSIEQTRVILEAGRKVGFMLNFHADELNQVGGAELAGVLEAEAVSHLEKISPEGISALVLSGTVAVLLPTTAYTLRLEAPPVRTLIDAGVPVALGTDFNPNAFCTSMPLVMNLACTIFKMTLNEALVAATLNAAHSLRRSRISGSIEVGKQADLVVINTNRWEHIVYQMGETSNLITHVVHQGKIVHKNEQTNT